VILNQELRYRHASGLGAVVFYDLGNVFARVHDLRFDLAATLGAGCGGLPGGPAPASTRASLSTARATRSRYRLFFGLGQAF